MSSEFPRDFQAEQDAIALIRCLSRHGDQPAGCPRLGLPLRRLAAAQQVMADWGLALDEPSTGRWRWPGGAPALLDAERITSDLPDGIRERLEVRVFPVIDSTSAWVSAQSKSIRNLACLAEYQTAGRGRRGRQWHMPFGSGIAMSMRWDTSRWDDVPPRVTLTLGIAIAGLLREMGVDGIGVKWPNDLLVSGRKLGGILVEQRHGGDQSWLVIGLGLNVRLPPSAPIDQPWTDLTSVLSGSLPERNCLAARLLEVLAEALCAFPEQDPSQLSRQWAAFDVLAGEPVRVECPDGVIDGLASGVDETGRLRVAKGEAQWLLHSGEVRVRRRAS
jgi:BirA family transcriptional regulator, biotin operon repressor / biotin---[acetyl-CoA-carboxylase] ligase